MPPTIHIIRTAEGGHHTDDEANYNHDPTLAPIGRSQCISLQNTFPFQPTFLISSPLRRAINTADLSFYPIPEKPIILLAELQETGCLLFDRGSSWLTLISEFRRKVNLKYLPFGWEKKGPTTRFATDVEKIEKRAVDTRVWLRNLAKEEANEDAHIVVVTHGTFAHFLVQDFEGMDGFGGFEHGEWRSYHFKSLREMNDQKVKLVELESSRAKRVTEKRAGAEPLSKHEKTMA